jgi:DNA repair photolyase
MDERPGPVPGRGAAHNPKNRFYTRSFEADPEAVDPEEPLPRTEFIRDASRSIIARNDSPDIGFEASVNPYRGCEHGCSYCYSRPFHEYLGFSAGLDFETKILVKEDAPELLRKELSSPRWLPKTLALSGVTDAYQPVERRLGLTRRILEVLAEFRNPVWIVTKNHLVTRDTDLLTSLAAHRAAAVTVSITTLDTVLARTMEPRTSTPKRRMEAIARLAGAGIPVGVNVAPVIPGLTDHEMPAILKAAAGAGATFAGHAMIRLPYAVKDLFETWLSQHVPERKDKVLHRIREVRGGALNDPKFGSRMSGHGAYADQVHSLFRLGCRKARLSQEPPELSAAGFRPPPGPQLTLFD